MLTALGQIRRPSLPDVVYVYAIQLLSGISSLTLTYTTLDSCITHLFDRRTSRQQQAYKLAPVFHD